MKKDRGFVAISAIWYERYLECSRTCMTSDFPDSVWRFYHSLLNLDDEDLAIKTKVDNYVKDVWQPRINSVVKNNTQYTTDSDTIRLERRIIEAQYIHEVFDFIIQTIQDSGVGWMINEEMQQYMINQQ